MVGFTLLQKYGSLFFLLANLGLSRCAQDCHPLDQCSCKLSDGGVISLWAINKEDGTGYEANDELSRGFTYLYNPCTGLKKPDSECNGALGCQTSGSDSFAIALKPAAIKTAYDTIAKQFQFIYDGTSTKLTYPRVTTLNLKCDPSIKSATLSTVLEQPTGTYSLTISSKCACPDQCKYAPSPNTSSSSNLGTGSILCIVFLVLVVVYFVGGIVVNKYARHKEGLEIIPNREFWKEVPFLAKDGAVFAYGKVSGRNSDYNQIG